MIARGLGNRSVHEMIDRCAFFIQDERTAEVPGLTRLGVVYIDNRFLPWREIIIKQDTVPSLKLFECQEAVIPYLCRQYLAIQSGT